MNPGGTFTQFCAAKYKEVSALYRMKFDYNKSNEQFSLSVMSDYWFLKFVNLIRQTM